MMHDELIDAVARDMTGEASPVDLRARVIANLTARTAGRPLRFVMPITAAAGLALAWVLAGPSGPSGPAGPSGSAGSSGSAGPSASSIARASESLEPSPAGPGGPAGPAEPDPWLSRAVPRLAEFPPVEISLIQPPPLSIAPISVDAIVSEPITLPPLDARSGGRE